MDYEKKYKEANDKVVARFGINVAKEIFTDLYESEDEKIRNEIIGFVKQAIHSGGGIIVAQEKENRWIAWLEKQATPQMVEDAFLKGCNDTKKSFLKKQSEQKITKWNKEDDKIIFTIIKEGNLKPSERNWLKSLKERIGGK